jgi:hypothetical protein
MHKTKCYGRFKQRYVSGQARLRWNRPINAFFDTIGPLTLKLRKFPDLGLADKNDAAVIVLQNGKVALSVSLLSSTESVVVVPFKEGQRKRVHMSNYSPWK